MKTLAFALFKKLLKKYWKYAFAYLLTKVLQVSFNKYESTENALRQFNQMTKALNAMAAAVQDGEVTEKEIEELFPLLQSAIDLKD